MLSEHDNDMIPRCRRLGHEVPFGYCRRETAGNPCRLILDCWWERFDVRSFLQANLPEVVPQLEQTGAGNPSSKVVNLLDLIQQARNRAGDQAADSQ